MINKDKKTNIKKSESKSFVVKRGLAAASKETRLKVASMGGKSYHDVRGLQGSTAETRTKVASMGGTVSSGNKAKAKKAGKKKK